MVIDTDKHGKQTKRFINVNQIQQVYQLNTEVIPSDGIGKNKCLSGIELSNIQQQLIELKEFYDNSTLSRSN
jgi:hypothetical protein